jgi:hypothetical protein
MHVKCYTYLRNVGSRDASATTAVAAVEVGGGVPLPGAALHKVTRGTQRASR